MQIFVINLDRKPERWQRMAGLLEGLPFTRIAAVDGKNIDGPEKKGRPYPGKILSRYQIGCILSHRAAYESFLKSADRYCCVLEDDVYLSPDFSKFINDDKWIPSGCDLVKIETTRQQVRFIGRRIGCQGRQAVRLHSLHFGTAGYIISRRGAEILLEMTTQPDRAMDRIVFGRAVRRRLQPVYQLIPALCIQGTQRGDGMIFPEMESSIRDSNAVPRLPANPTPASSPNPPKIVRVKKSLMEKVRREVSRPFHQLRAVRKNIAKRIMGVRREGVPFA
ncbi:MAG TPA: glycosyltransferase family 25 protein [Verrucomicrobiae bacterium]|nr:glycosyltransferase family 25 protein [Verrucomicrobiae bacterium]